jgi:hypothetical protein
MDPIERARKLVALATDKGASSEEGRTAAMAACRLIVKHKLLDSSADHHGNGAARRRPSRGRPAHDGHDGHREARSDERASYRAGGSGTCAFCDKPFGPSDDVMTYPNHSVDHWHCAKRRAAGAQPGI